MPAILVEVALPLVTAGVGVLATALAPYFRGLLGRRRYQARVAALESEAGQAPSPPAAELTVTGDGLAELGDRLGQPPYLYLTGLRVRNLRCFRDVSLRLRFPGEYPVGREPGHPNVTLLLGNNGSGKSTVLKAIAMAALGPVLTDSGFSAVAYRLIARGAEQAVVDSSFVFGADGPELIGDSVSLTTKGDFVQVKASATDRYWSELFDESSPSFFIVGYGTNRHLPEDWRRDTALNQSPRGRRFRRVASLFDDRVPLVPLGSWLQQASSRRQNEVRDLFKELLPQHASFTGQFEGDEPVFLRRDIPVPLRAMSDGFRSYISWLGDLFYQLDVVAPIGTRLTGIGGIVLVDEVDLLLHPSWQREVVPTVSKMLPKIQFVFTTHSPIVAATLESENIVLAREEEAPEEEEEHSGSKLATIGAEIHGLSAEQVLLSSYFGLDTTRAPDTEPRLEELARRAVEGDEQSTLDFLRAYVDPGRRPTGREPRE